MTSDAFLKKLKNVLTTSDTSSEGLRAQHQRPIDVLTRFWADEDNQDVKELVSRHVRFLKDAAADADDSMFKTRTFDVFWVDKSALMHKDGFAKVRKGDNATVWRISRVIGTEPFIA